MLSDPGVGCPAIVVLVVTKQVLLIYCCFTTIPVGRVVAEAMCRAGGCGGYAVGGRPS